MRLQHAPRESHDRIAIQWDSQNKYKTKVKLSVLSNDFEVKCDEAFDDGARPEVLNYEAEIVWPLWNPYGIAVGKTKDMGNGLVASGKIPANTIVLAEWGIMGTRDDCRLPVALLSTSTELYYPPMDPIAPLYPDSYSPFPDYTVAQWNQARHMVVSNAFTVNDDRVLFGMVSRLNHSCSSNLVRKHFEDGLICLATTEDILPGDNLHIQYSSQSGHEEKEFFTCNCTIGPGMRSYVEVKQRDLWCTVHISGQMLAVKEWKEKQARNQTRVGLEWD